MTEATACGKRAYRYKIEADLVLARAQLWAATGRQQGKMPIRAYACQGCGFWHLTSKPDRAMG